MTTQTQPVTDIRPRCQRCGRVLGERLTRPWEVRCSKSRCKHYNSSPADAVNGKVVIVEYVMGRDEPVGYYDEEGHPITLDDT